MESLFKDLQDFLQGTELLRNINTRLFLSILANLQRLRISCNEASNHELSTLSRNFAVEISNEVIKTLDNLKVWFPLIILFEDVSNLKLCCSGSCFLRVELII